MRNTVALARVPLLGRIVPWYLQRRIPGAGTSAFARTRLIDDLLVQELRNGAEQVVILGAGFDCRALRLAEVRGATVLEVDAVTTQTRKRDLLRGAGVAEPANVKFVPMDFLRDKVATRLNESGFDPSRKTVFLWEGVTNYLTPEAVDEVLAFVASTGAGNELIWTYVDRGALDGSGKFWDAAAILRSVRAIGEEWTFGLPPEELREFARARGFALESDLGAREYRAKYFGASANAMRGYGFYHVAAMRVIAGPANATPRDGG